MDHFHFHSFLGIDQTGAARNQGKSAAPLKAFWIRREKESAWVGSPVLIPSLTRSALETQFQINQQFALVIDSVFGLPFSCWPHGVTSSDHLWKLLRKTHLVPGYGRKASELYFNRILAQSDHQGQGLPSRLCEEKAKANSLFLVRPFQRNIQTGTFRVWKDLATGENQRWCNFWPYDTLKTGLKNAPWVFEGYPSWLWKNLFSFKKRSPKQIRNIFGGALKVSPKDLKALEFSPDFADAAVLAWSAVLLQEQNHLFRKIPKTQLIANRIQKEGWLLGLEMESV
jgi:hypothetical protein